MFHWRALREDFGFDSIFFQSFSSVVEGTVIFNAVDGPDSGVVTGIGCELKNICLPGMDNFKKFKKDAPCQAFQKSRKEHRLKGDSSPSTLWDFGHVRISNTLGVQFYEY
ncbi:hypothetical protein Tco_0168668 [Tanacetum coccineum]